MASIWMLETIVFEFSRLGAVVFCFTLAVAYVASLYVRASRKYPRDHSETIKERFIRVFTVCIIAVPFFWSFSTRSHSVKAKNVFTWLGMRCNGGIMAATLPLLLTMILFLGPLSLHYLDGIFKLYKDWNYWLLSFRNVAWIRNHIVGPLTEEFVFRACMLPVLVPTFGENWSLILCPLFFGVAHLHHMIEKIQEGVNFKTAFLQTGFQFGYTTIFGVYSAFLFLRTGHLLAPLLAHAFCNHMGFPHFEEIFAHQVPTRYFVIAAFLVGLILWSLLLFPITNPHLYSNDLFYSR